jgi:hypothetical protein
MLFVCGKGLAEELCYLLSMNSLPPEISSCIIIYWSFRSVIRNGFQDLYLFLSKKNVIIKKSILPNIQSIYLCIINYFLI